MVTDPYADAQNLADILRAEHMSSWAQQIEDAVAGGATATEILMALRWVVEKLLEQLPSGHHLESRARALVNEVNVLLA